MRRDDDVVERNFKRVASSRDDDTERENENESKHKTIDDLAERIDALCDALTRVFSRQRGDDRNRGRNDSRARRGEDNARLIRDITRESGDVERLMRRGASAGELANHFDARFREAGRQQGICEDFDQAARATGAKLRGEKVPERDCRSSLVRRAADSRQTDEQWGDVMNAVGRELRGS